MFTDADTHADECEETWSYIPAEHRQLTPRTISFTEDELPEWFKAAAATGSSLERFWFIDGTLFPRRHRSDERTGTTADTRELRDVALRLKHMDELDVDVQVIYPTLFISEVTRRPETEVVLTRSYNRWLAERCAESGGRLRWVAVIPFSSMPDALEEMRFAKDHGACGLFKRAIEFGDRGVNDPYYFPAYELASDLGLPICVHVANEWQPVIRGMVPTRLGSHHNFPVLQAFTALVSDRIPSRFPRLRVGFIESSSAWVPYLLRFTGATDRGENLASLRFYVTCEADEDLAYLIEASGGADNLFIGTDYSHTDRSALREAHRIVCRRGDLSAEQARKVTSENALAFYGLAE